MIVAFNSGLWSALKGALVASSIAFTGLVSASCSSSVGAGAADSGTPQVYTPYIGDFCGYKSWTTYVEPDGGGDGQFAATPGSDAGFIHVAGGRTEYINHVPPHGATAFPVGTIIVKVIPSQSQVFAMAKRGGGYNANGPGGAPIEWEWFELDAQSCETGFVWQGATPPSSQAYGGSPDACNQCHSGFKGNDYVGSPRILLKDY